MSNELYHYGVKGMKWGVRKKQYDSMSFSERRATRQKFYKDNPNENRMTIGKTVGQQLGTTAGQVLGKGVRIAGKTLGKGIKKAGNIVGDKFESDSNLGTIGKGIRITGNTVGKGVDVAGTFLEKGIVKASPYIGKGVGATVGFGMRVSNKLGNTSVGKKILAGKYNASKIKASEISQDYVDAGRDIVEPIKNTKFKIEK